jgi:hypothetical protein
MQGHWRNDVKMWFIFIRTWSSGSCKHDIARLGSIIGGKQNKFAQEETLVTCLRGGRYCSDVAGTTIPWYCSWISSVPPGIKGQRLKLGHHRFVSCPSQFSNCIRRSAVRNWDLTTCSPAEEETFQRNQLRPPSPGYHTRRRVPEYAVIVALEVTQPALR